MDRSSQRGSYRRQLLRSATWRTYMPGEYFPEVVVRRDASPYFKPHEVKCGWYITDDACQYATCGGNVWGMRKDGELYHAYFSGRRSRIKDFIGMMKVANESFQKETAKVVVHRTEAPADMHWWEIRDDYLDRKEREKAAAKERAEKARIRSDRQFSRENNPFGVLQGVVKG